MRKGEFLVLLGPSGCGKTTTLRMIGGFERPDNGKIWIKGQDVSQLPPDKRDTNTVFQSYALFPHMTVADNVGFGPKMAKMPKSERKEKIERVLGLVKLDGYGGRRPNQLSGGQQQRIALARAIINEPTVLLLDEPLGALDLKLRKAMQIELKNIQKTLGMTFIHVTHDQDEALTMADRIVVMRSGKIEQIGTPLEIYEFPTNAYVCDFVGTINMLEGTIVNSTSKKVMIKLESQASFWVPAMENLVGCKNVIVGVRPEKIIIADSVNKEYIARVSGKIINVNYLGSFSAYRIMLASGELIDVINQNVMQANLYEIGSTVNLQWSEVSMKIFPKG